MADRVVVYHWAQIEEHLNRLLADVHKSMEPVEGPEMHRLQGEARCLRKLLNLPDTLTVLHPSQEEVAHGRRPD